MPLLERQAQLETLQRCLQEARAGCGKLTLLSAEAGLGKSVLVEGLASEHRRDARTLSGAEAVAAAYARGIVGRESAPAAPTHRP